MDAFYAGKAHRLAEEWVGRGGVPGERAEAMRVTGVAGLRVTLRLDGITLGTGTTLRPDFPTWLTPSPPGSAPHAAAERRSGSEVAGTPRSDSAIDLITLLEPAVTQALAEVESKLNHRHAPRPAPPAGNDAPADDTPADEALPDLSAQNMAQVLPRLRVGLQILHHPVPIVLASDAADDALYARFAPGYHSLIALPTDHSSPSIVWPATALGHNASPRRQVIELLTGIGLKFNQTRLLGRPGGPALYRADVIHIVRPRIDLPAMQLTRGTQIIADPFIGGNTLDGLTDRVAYHLAGRLIGGGRVRGAYHPATGRYNPDLADDVNASLTAYSLLTYVQVRRSMGFAGESYDRIEASAVEVVERVVGRLLAPEASGDVVPAAFSLLALVAAQPATYEPALRTRVADLVTRHFTAEAELRNQTDAAHGNTPGNTPGSAPHAAAEPSPRGEAAGTPGNAPGDVSGRASGGAVPPASTAVALASLAALYDQTRDPQLAQQLAAALTHFWEKSRGRFDLNALPWITLAYDRAAPLLVRDGKLTQQQADAWGKDLSVYFDAVAERQVVGQPDFGPGDVVGGIVLTPGPEGSPPNPTWQTAQVLMYLAVAARQPDIVPQAQRPGVLVTAAGAARFIAQLMIDTPGCFAVRSPGEALGGIRLSPWDNTLDLPPSAFSLLGLLELRRTTHHLAAPPAP